jgi:hypothetical protein
MKNEGTSGSNRNPIIPTIQPTHVWISLEQKKYVFLRWRLRPNPPRDIILPERKPLLNKLKTATHLTKCREFGQNVAQVGDLVDIKARA